MKVEEWLSEFLVKLRLPLMEFNKSILENIKRCKSAKKQAALSEIPRYRQLGPF